jgi:hypothetical protein
VKEVETNPHKIDQRQKQVDFGKNTLGYENYRKQVAKCGPSHPFARRCPYQSIHDACLEKHEIRRPPLWCSSDMGHPATPHHG